MTKYITFKEDIKNNNHKVLLNAKTKYSISSEEETVYIVEGFRIPKSCENDIYEIEAVQEVKVETKKKSKTIDKEEITK